MRSTSSHELKSTKAKQTGRHRAPYRIHRTIKIIGVVAPAAVLVGVFVAYQAGAQTHRIDPVANSADAYRLHAAPSGRARTEGSGTEGSGTKSSGKAPAKQSPKSTETAAPPRPSPAKTSSAKTSSARTSSARTSSARRPRPAHPSSAPQSSPPPPSDQGSQNATQAPPSSASGSASQSSSVQQDIADGNNFLAVAQYLVGKGYSRAAAAGVASCVDGESGGNPESVGSGGGGLIGWTPISSAAPDSNIITGNVSQDMMTQLTDLLYYNSTEIGQSLVTQLDSISDPVAAADFYSQNFEKPAVTDSDVVPSVAEQVYSELGSLGPRDWA